MDTGAVQVDPQLLVISAWSLAMFGEAAHPLYGKLMRRLGALRVASFNSFSLRCLYQVRTPRHHPARMLPGRRAAC